jgi:hypothetical protein
MARMKTNCMSDRTGGAKTNTPAGGAAAAPQMNEVMALLGEVPGEAGEAEGIPGGALSPVMAEWVATQYLLAVRKQLAKLTDDEERLKLLQRTTRDLVALQRTCLAAAKLRLEEAKLEFEREKHRDALAAAAGNPKSEEPKSERNPKAEIRTTGGEKAQTAQKIEGVPEKCGIPCDAHAGRQGCLTPPIGQGVTPAF